MPLPTLPSGLYALCDDSVRPELPLVAKAQALLEGGVRVLQLRMKRTGGREAVVVAREIVERCHAVDALCIINDRVDWALLAGADGVHLGEEDLAPSDARTLLGPGRLIGVTVRTAEMAQVARAAGAGYVGAGPVFSTSSKTVSAPVMGTAALARLVVESPLPVVGIGGIGLANIGQVAATGAHGAAVLSDLLLSGDVAGRARALADAFAAGSRTRGGNGAGDGR